MRPQSSASTDWRTFGRIVCGRARRIISICRLALLPVVLYALVPGQAFGSLIVQVDNVNIVTNGSMAVNGFIEVYATLTGGTTVSNISGFDFTFQFQSPAIYTGASAVATTIHPWVFASNGGTITSVGSYSASTPSFDGLINSGSTTLTNGEGFLKIPFSVPAGDFGTYTVVPTFTFLSDSQGNPIPVNSVVAGDIIVSPSAVPEPSSMVLSVIAATGFLAFRRRRRAEPALAHPTAVATPTPS